MKKNIFLYLLLLSTLTAQYSCKSSKQSQNTGMEDVPYIPPLISTDNSSDNKENVPTIKEKSPTAVEINTPPPIHPEEIASKPTPETEKTVETPPPPANAPDLTLAGYTKDRIRFRVQIGAFKAALLENDPFFKPIAGEEVRVERSPDNYYRYSLGWLDNYNQAETYKNELKAKGFPNAFLVAFGDDDKRINMPIDKVLEWYLK